MIKLKQVRMYLCMHVQDVYLCMYVQYVYMYIPACVRIYILVCKYIHIIIYVCVYIYIYMWMHTYECLLVLACRYKLAQLQLINFGSSL